MLTATDPYESRLEGPASTGERVDPVVWGPKTASPGGTLSAAPVAQFDREGYLFFPGLLNPTEVARLRIELDRLRNSPEMRDRDEVIAEPNSGEVRSVFAVHTLSKLMAQLANDGRLLDVVTHLLASQVYLHQSRINYKSGFVGKEFYWHSDFETWHMEDGMPRMRAISCSVALTENTPNNGPLMVIPGSHRTYVRCAGKTPENNHLSSLKKQEIGVPSREILTQLAQEGGIIAPTGPAGSVLFFECNLMHGSNSNITPLPRSNVFMVYNSVENALVDPYCGLKPRPEHIAHRQVNPLG